MISRRKIAKKMDQNHVNVNSIKSDYVIVDTGMEENFVNGENSHKKAAKENVNIHGNVNGLLGIFFERKKINSNNLISGDNCWRERANERTSGSEFFPNDCDKKSENKSDDFIDNFPEINRHGFLFENISVMSAIQSICGSRPVMEAKSDVTITEMEHIAPKGKKSVWRVKIHIKWPTYKLK